MLPLTANSFPMQVVTSRLNCLGKALCDDSGQTLLPVVPCQPCSCSHGPGALSMVSTPQCPTPLLGYLIPSECSNTVCHLYFFILLFFFYVVLEEYAPKCLQQKPLIWKSHFSSASHSTRAMQWLLAGKLAQGTLSSVCLSPH